MLFLEENAVGSDGRGGDRYEVAKIRKILEHHLLGECLRGVSLKDVYCIWQKNKCYNKGQAREMFFSHSNPDAGDF